MRGQAVDPETDLSAVIADLNRLVFESSAQNRYATFFLRGVRFRFGRSAVCECGAQRADGDTPGRRGCAA
jgi:hypothetical protein